MHINRGLLFWGVALITAGAVALAASQAWFDPSVLAGSWRLWPLVLIAIGISIVLARTSFGWLGSVAAGLIVGLVGGALISGAPAFGSCSGEPGTPETSSGTFLGPRASVDLDLTCGTLAVSMTDGSGWQAETAIQGGDQPSRSGSLNALEIHSGDRGLPFDRDREAWTLQLGRDVAYDFNATLNAAETKIDGSGATFDGFRLTNNAGSTHLVLSGAQVADMQLQLNAGSAEISTDGETDLAGSLHANAGTINLCTPEGSGIQIVLTSSVAFSNNLEDRGLSLEGDDTWVSPGFAAAAHKLVLQVQGNAATFNLNPEEGCT